MMASTLNLAHVHRPSIVKFSSAPSTQFAGFGAAIGKLKLPTDSIGSSNLTLINVVVGSRVHIRDQADTTTIYDQLAAASTVVIPLQVYATGSALNDLRIRIRKASAAPTYRPYETLLTATLSPASIYVSQLQDD